MRADLGVMLPFPAFFRSAGKSSTGKLVLFAVNRNESGMAVTDGLGTNPDKSNKIDHPGPVKSYDVGYETVPDREPPIPSRECFEADGQSELLLPEENNGLRSIFFG